MNDKFQEFSMETFDSFDYIQKKSLHLVQHAKYSHDKGSQSVNPLFPSLITAFDPQPFIQSFEHELEDLSKLSKFCLGKIGEFEDSEAATAQTTHKDWLNDLARDFITAENEFESLENRISQVGNGAMIIGEQLEALDKERIRGQEAKDLVSFFIEFNSGNSSRLDALKNSEQDLAKVASIIKRLYAISKEVDFPSAEKARLGIQAYYENIEKEILDDFDQAYKDGEIKIMAKCARILYDFNGGYSSAQVYVNQHEFFAKNLNMFVETSPDSMPNTLPKLLTEYSNFSSDSTYTSSLKRLYGDILAMLPDEWSVIQEVFPNPSAVSQMFLQRLFAQSIQNAIENCLKSAASMSLLHYLDSLSQIHQSTLELCEKLKVIFESHEDDSNAFTHQISITISRIQDDLFIQYIDNDKYIEKELKCLQHAHNLALKEFIEFQNQRKLALKNKTVFSHILGNSSSTSTNAPDSAQVHFQHGISLDIVDEIIGAHARAASRCSELSNHADIPKNMGVLFSSLLEFMGKRYIEAWLDITIEDLLSSLDMKTEPDLKFLSLVYNANQAIHKMQSYFQNKILPLICNQPTVHRELLIRKNEFVSVLEAKLNVIIQKAVDYSVAWMSQILSKQKKFDYRPKESELVSFATLTSTPCGQCCEYVKKLHDQLKQHLDGMNLEHVLAEIANLFYRFLIEHFKKFTINTNGGLLLTKDLVKYQETFAIFKISIVNDRFEALRQLGNLYLVKPENLKTVIDDGILSRMNPSILHTFVMNRADYKQENLEHLFIGVGTRPQASQNKWEKTFEDAVGAVGGTFEEVGESLKKFLFI